MRNLKRLTYYVNRLQALDDFNALAKVVAEAGDCDLVARYTPDPHDSLRHIDDCIANLRSAFQRRLAERIPRGVGIVKTIRVGDLVLDVDGCFGTVREIKINGGPVPRVRIDNTWFEWEQIHKFEKGLYIDTVLP